MKVRKAPKTLEEAYLLRDSSNTREEWDTYQEEVYRLRRNEYRRRNIKTARSVRRRERARAGGAWRRWRTSVGRLAQSTRTQFGAAAGHPLFAFYSLTILITWSLWIPAIAAYGSSLLAPPTSNVLLVVGGFGPSLSAIALTAVADGRAGVRDLLGGLLGWRVGAGWYAMVLLLPPGLCLLAIALYAMSGDASVRYFSPVPWYMLPAYFLLILAFVGPLQEEVGWRGYALPVLQARRSPLVSGLIVGLLWAFWHLPLAWIGRAGRSGPTFLFFALAVVGLSVLFTWTYNGTRGSLFICVLFHASTNTALWCIPVLEPGTPPLGPSLVGVGLLWTVTLTILFAGRIKPSFWARSHGHPKKR